MKKLKQNAFWASCAALAAILVAIVGLKLVPLMGDRATARLNVERSARTLVADLDSGVPSDKTIAEWRQRKTIYVEDYRAISSYYAKHDETLEGWFPSLLEALPAGAKIPYNLFSTHYRDESRKLERRLTRAGVGKFLREKGIQVKEGDLASLLKEDDLERCVQEIGLDKSLGKDGLRQMLEAGVMIGTPMPAGGDSESGPRVCYGFNWQDMSEIQWSDLSPADQDEVILKLQKRFWIARHVADACAPTVEGRLEPLARRLLDLRFFAPLSKKGLKAQPLPSGVPTPEYVGLGGPLGASDYQESALPDQLGRTMTFGVSVEIPFENIPLFLQHLLSTEQLIVNVTGCRMFAARQNDLKRTETRKIEAADAPRKAQLKQQWEAEEEAKVKPVYATVWLTCQAIDFGGTLPAWVTAK